MTTPSTFAFCSTTTKLCSLILFLILAVSVCAAEDGSIAASADKTTLLVAETATGTITITEPDIPGDKAEIRYVGDIKKTGVSVTGEYLPLNPPEGTQPEILSGVTMTSSTGFSFSGSKPGTWKETFSISFSIATEAKNPDTGEWEPAGDESLGTPECIITFTVNPITVDISIQGLAEEPTSDDNNSDETPNHETAPGAFIAIDKFESFTISSNAHFDTLTVTASGDGLELFNTNGSSLGTSTVLQLSENNKSFNLKVKGNTVSTSPRDKSLQVVHNSWTEAMDEAKVTIVKIDITVEEKAWGQDWSAPEDSGTDNEIPWFVLWNCDKHRFVVDVEGADVEDIQSVTVGEFGAATLQNDKWICEVPDGGIGNDKSVTAIVLIKTVNVTVESKPIDISGHNIVIEWQGARNFTDEASSTFGTLRLAKLHSQNNKWTAYQVPKDFNPRYYQVRTRIDISPEVPQGRKGTVHLEWYDPNDDDSNSTALTNHGNIRDNNANHGTVSFVGGKIFEFDDAHRQGTPTPTLGRKVLEFPNDCFRANFIVAAHPRSGVEQQYEFRDANKKVLSYKDHDDTWKTLGLCTQEMTVRSWYGFMVPDEWVFDKTAYTLRTPLPTINASASTSANNNASPESLLDYNCDFSMQVGFDYVGTDYVAGYTNVTTPHNKNPHRSFHRNSGIKIYDLYEIQIYDTASLLAQSSLETIGAGQQGSPMTNWQGVQLPSNGIKKTGDTSFESISGCVTGIPYLANVWHSKTQTDLSEVTGRKTLDFTVVHGLVNGSNPCVTITSSGETFPNLEYGTGGKYSVMLKNTPLRKIFIQSHWGSGVSYSSISINVK
jgi:hypothetical protein